MRRSALVVTFAVVLALSLVATGPSGAAPTHAGTSIQVQVQTNGDAVWTVEARYNLSTENDTAAFERLRTEFEAGEATAGPTADVFREAAASVSARTGREMEIVEVDRSSRLTAGNGTQVGVLSLQFTWTNFAVVEDERISVGSSFAGGWFGDLGPEQTLRIRPPSGYRVQTASPSTDIIGGTLRWEGPQTFQPGEPSVEFQTPASPTTPGTTPPGIGIPWSYAAIGFVALILGGLVLMAWQGGYLGGSRSAGTDSGGPPDPGAGEAESAEGTADPSEAPASDAAGAGESETSGAESTGLESGAETAGAAAAGAAGAAEGADEEEEAVDTDLLSDEERVERLLKEHGGRMKQAQIVEETRWSNAKVSQLLSGMAEEERIEKLRIGRENLISLPEYDDEN